MQRRRPEELCVPDKSFVLLATGRHQVRVEMNINKSNSLWRGIFTFHNNDIVFTFDVSFQKRHQGCKEYRSIFLLSEEKHVEGCKVRNRRTGSVAQQLGSLEKETKYLTGLASNTNPLAYVNTKLCVKLYFSFLLNFCLK